MTATDAAADVTFRAMTEADAEAVARLHKEEISLGFLSSLGRRFLRVLYLGLLRSGEAVVYVAEADGRVVGFAAVTERVGGLYRKVLRSHWWRLIPILLPRLVSPAVVRHCWETLRYPSRDHAEDLPEAELLAIAVSRDAARAGIGRELLDRVLAELWARGVPAVKVLVNQILDRANAFYQTMGLRRARTIEIHGQVSNIYVAERPASTSGAAAPAEAEPT
jgi:ribosomal protein S18 acetylase RimI-like enzyme